MRTLVINWAGEELTLRQHPYSPSCLNLDLASGFKPDGTPRISLCGSNLVKLRDYLNEFYDLHRNATQAQVEQDKRSEES